MLYLFLSFKSRCSKENIIKSLRRKRNQSSAVSKCWKDCRAGRLTAASPTQDASELRSPEHQSHSAVSQEIVGSAWNCWQVPVISVYSQKVEKQKTISKCWPLNLHSHQREVMVHFSLPKSIYSFSELPNFILYKNANFRMSWKHYNRYLKQLQIQPIYNFTLKQIISEDYLWTHGFKRHCSALQH